MSADDPLLARCAERPATPVRVPCPTPASARRHPTPLLARYREFTPHAATSVAPHQPHQLEKLCRYLTRPPIPQRRLRELPDGRIALDLKRPRRGVRSFVFEPVALLARIAALVPMPWFVLFSDGGANVDITDIEMIAGHADDGEGEGLYLIGVGVGDPWNFNDNLMDALTDAGKAAYIFRDSTQEANAMWADRFVSNVQVAARDVQVELTLPPTFQVKKFCSSMPNRATAR